MLAPKEIIQYFTGLDLGQTQEFTALAVLEKTLWQGIGTSAPAQYAIRYLERFSLGTPYQEVIDRLAGMFAEEPLRKSTLVVDETAVGKPVVDLVRAEGFKADIKPLVVTGGWGASQTDGVWQVPKQELVSTLQILLQARRLKVPSSLAQAQTLLDELANFKMKFPLANGDPLVQWREGQHDDLVLATAMAAWKGERTAPPSRAVPFAVGGCPRLR